MWFALRRALRRFINLVRWSAIDRDLHDEVAVHLEMSEAEHRRHGLSAEAAHRLALLEFGGERWIEDSRSTRGLPWLQETGRDVRYAMRGFRRNRSFALMVVIVMALGVGATTAVYSVIRGILLSPLPYADPDALYTVLESNSDDGRRVLSYPTFRDVSDAVGSDAQLAYVRGESLTVRGDDGTMNLLGAFATPNIFELMGVASYAGRTFTITERTSPVAVLSWRMATRVFGEARSAVGESVVTADGAFTVIGVMPPGFAYPAWADLWLPIGTLPAAMSFALEQRNLHVDSDVIVRVESDVSAEQLGTMLSAPIARAGDMYPEPGARFDRAVLTSIRDRVLGTPAPRLGPLFGAATLVLLLASVNIAGLVLARGTARRGELVTRLALGAGRGQLVRQLVTESMLLGVAGGVVGVVLAHVAVLRLKASALTQLPRLEEVTVDGGALLFALVVTLLSAVAFGAFAAWRVTGGVAADAMRGAGRSLTADHSTSRMRSGMVIAQIALAIVLLVGANLLVRTNRALLNFDLGFEPAGLIVIDITPVQQYGDDQARMQFYDRLRSAIANVAGAESVALANHLPLSGGSMPTAVRTEREVAPDANTLALFRAVSTDYLTTIGATPVRGRLLTDGDAHGTGIVVNEVLARREWGNTDPIGRPITVFRSAQGAANFGGPLPGHVVGVVRDIRERGPDQPVPPAVYVPIERNVWSHVNVVVKATVPSSTIVPALQAAIRDVDADIPTAGPHPFNEFRTMETLFESAIRARKLAMGLLVLFAATALVLSLTGLFAILAFIVTQRTREIGLRMALGARRSDAARLVLRQSTVLVCLGLVIGFVATIPAMRVLEGSLFGVERMDGVSYAITCVLFLATAGLAALLPARRAAAIDPMASLRAE